MKRPMPLLIFFLLTTVLLAACTAAPNTALPQEASTHTIPSSAQASPTPTSQPSSTLTIRPTLAPTHTPQPTATPEPVGNWQVPVVDLHWAENGYDSISYWTDSSSVLLESSSLGSVIVNAASGETTLRKNESGDEEYDEDAYFAFSDDYEYQIACTDAGLEMQRLSDEQLLSQTDIVLDVCYQVLWAGDDSAASFVTNDGEVFVWKIDGSAPYQVGKARPYTLAPWSPDNKKLLVLRGAASMSPSDATFNIIYLDGRPMKETGAIIEAGNEWEPNHITWFTNDIVRNFIGCVIPNYCMQDFYHADSGKFLIRNSIGEMGGQEALLSPDERWLVLEAAPNADKWEDLYTFSGEDETYLVLYDLKSLRKLIWAKGQPDFSGSGGLSFQFIGWSADSRQFYFTHYPFGNLSTGLPFGYTSLDRSSMKMQLLIPSVLYTQFSRDRQHIFMVTAEQTEPNMAYGVQAAVYTLDGKPVTQPQRIAEQLPFDELNPTDFFNEGSYDPYSDLIPSRWNRDSTQVAFAIPGGEVWLMGTDGSVQLLLSDLPFVEEYWQEDVRFSWPPEGNFLFFRWGDHAWIARLH